MRNIDLQTYRKLADTNRAPLQNPVSIEAEGSQYDRGFVLPRDRDPYAALNENRAQKQTWQDKLGNGLVNMGASAFAGATESTVGLVYGSLDALIHWDASKFYDNEVGRALDAVTNAAKESNPFYYSQAEEESSALGSMGYANFWFDKVLGSSGYTLGSLATGYGMARLFKMGKTAMLGQLGEEAMAGATTGANAVEGLSNAAGIKAKWDMAKELGLGTVMAYGESSSEARTTANETQKFYEDARFKGTKFLSNGQPNPEYKPEFEKYANLSDEQILQFRKDAGNTNFLMNMLITGPTNTLLLGKWINPGKKEAVKLFNELGTRELAGGTIEYFDKVAARKGRALLNLGEKFLEGFATEGGQEGFQYASNIASQEFVKMHGMDGKGFFSSLAEGLGEGLSRAVSDKEGIQSILAGGISGGPFALKGARSERLAADKNTQDLVTALNEDPNFLKANKFVKDFVASTKLTLEANQDLKAGDIFNAKNKTDQALNQYIKSQIEKGSLDYFITRLKSLKEQDPSELAKYFGEGTTAEDIDKIIDKTQKLNELNDNITTLYGISGGTEAQRAYNAQLRERLFYSAATIKDVEQRIETIRNEFNSLDNKELHNIMMLRDNIINLNKTHAPENAPEGVNYEEYLKQAEKNVVDAYNTAVKDYEKNRPVEAAEHLEKLADLNKLENRKRDFINYYDLLNNPEKANALLEEEQKALEELANQAEADAKKQEEEERKAAEAQLPDELINDTFKKDVKRTNVVTDLNNNEIDLSTIDDADLRGLLEDIDNEIQIEGPNDARNALREAVQKELSSRENGITVEELKSQLRGAKTLEQVSEVLQKAQDNGFIVDEEKKKAIIKEIEERIKRRTDEEKVKASELSKFQDVREFSYALVLPTEDFSHIADPVERKAAEDASRIAAKERLDDILNSTPNIYNEITLKVVKNPKPMTPTVLPGMVYGMSSSPLSMAIMHNGKEIAYIPYYGKFTDVNGNPIDPMLLSYKQWEDIFQPKKERRTQANFEEYKRAYEGARVFFEYVNTQLEKSGKSEYTNEELKLILNASPTLGWFDIITPSQETALIDTSGNPNYPLFRDENGQPLIIDTNAATPQNYKSLGNAHIDPNTYETREEYKEALQKLAGRKSNSIFKNERRLLQRYVALVKCNTGTITIPGQEGKFEWMGVTPAKTDMNDVLTTIKELVKQKASPAEMSTALNEKFFFSFQAGWDVGLHVTKDYSQFTLEFKFGTDPSVYANVSLKEDMTVQDLLDGLNKSLVERKQLIGNEDAVKVIGQITDENFRMQIPKIETMDAMTDEGPALFQSILTKGLKKNLTFSLGYKAPSLPSTRTTATPTSTVTNSPTRLTTQEADKLYGSKDGIDAAGVPLPDYAYNPAYASLLFLRGKIKISGAADLQLDDKAAEALMKYGIPEGVIKALKSPLYGTTLNEKLGHFIDYLEGRKPNLDNLDRKMTDGVINQLTPQSMNILKTLTTGVFGTSPITTNTTTPSTPAPQPNSNLEQTKGLLKTKLDSINLKIQQLVSAKSNDKVVRQAIIDANNKKITIEELDAITKQWNNENGLTELIKEYDKTKAELEALNQSAPTQRRANPRGNAPINPDNLAQSTGVRVDTARDLAKAVTYLHSIFGNAINVQELEGLEQNLANGKTLYGDFKDALIRLSRFSPDGTEYHEAFHAVFRGFLNDEEIEFYRALGKDDLYKALKAKGKSINEAFIEFKNDYFAKNPGSILTDTELKNLMVEEHLADKFKDWKLSKEQKSAKTLLGKLWERITNFINSFTQNTKEIDDLDALFSSIDAGRFKNAKIVTNQFTGTILPADISLYTGTEYARDEDGRIRNDDFGNPIVFPRFLPEHVANKLIGTILANVHKARKQNPKIPFSILIEQELNNLRTQFDIQDAKFEALLNSTNEKAINLLYDLDFALDPISGANAVYEEDGSVKVDNVGNIVVPQKSPRREITNAVMAALKSFNYDLDAKENEEADDDQKVPDGGTSPNEESKERNRDLNAENLGGWSNLSKKLRAYISLTTYTTSLDDFFGTSGLFEGTEEITLAVDTRRVYNGIAKACQNSLTSKEVMTRLYHYRNVSQESRFVIDRLLEDLNFPIDSFEETGEYSEADLNPDTIDIYNAFVKGFNLHSFDHMFTEIDFNKGVTRTYTSNRKGSDVKQFNEWKDGYTTQWGRWGKTPEQRKAYIEKEIIPALIKAKNILSIKPAKQKYDNTIDKEVADVAKALEAVGIKVSEGYIRFMVLNNTNYDNKTNKQASYVDSFQYNIKENQEYLIDTLDQLIEHLAKDDNPFVRTKGTVAVKKEGDKVKEVEAGLITRLLTMASNNEVFDETVSPNSYLNAENKTIYALQQPTPDSIITLAIARDRHELLPLNYEKDPFFKDHYLLNNANFNKIKRYIKIIREDGGRVRPLKYNEVTKKFEVDVNQQSEQGVTFGQYKARELALADYNHYLDNRFDTSVGRGQVQTRPVLLDVMENASSLNLVALPTIDSYKDGQITDEFKKAILNEVKREWDRIQRVKAEGVSPENKIEGYNYGATDDKLRTLRGYNFWQFKELVNHNGSTLGKELLETADFTAFQDRLLEQIDSYFQAQIEEHLDLLAKENIIRRKYIDGRKVYVNVLLDTRYGRRDLKTKEGKWIDEDSAVREKILAAMKGDGRPNPFTSEYLPNNVGQVFLSNYLNRLSYNQFIKGDAALGLKNPIDWFKRAKARNASYKSLYSEEMPETRFSVIGVRNPVTGKIEDPTESFTVTNRLLDMNNPEDRAEYDELIESIQADLSITEDQRLKKLADIQKKGKVDVADAQGYVTAEAYLGYLHGIGKLTNETRAIYNKIVAGKEVSPKEWKTLKDQGVMANSLKVVYYDGTRFLKLSVQLLSKQEVAVEVDGEWVARPGKEPKFNMLQQMEQNRIHLVVPPSASKMLTQNVVELDTNNNFTITDPSKQISTISNLFAGLQQENPSNKTVITDPTQMKTVIEAEQDSSVEITYPFAPGIKTVGDLVKHYGEAQAQKILRSYVPVKNVIFALDSKNQINPNMGRLARIMRENLLRTGASEELLEFFETDLRGNPKYDFANMPHTLAKFEALYNAHFNTVFSQKVPGYKVTLQSAFGHKLMYYENADGTETIVNAAMFEESPEASKKYLEDYAAGKLKTRELAYNKPRYDENGKEIGRYCEFVMSAHFAEQFGLKPGDIIPDEIAYMFGVRIPSQDKHSAVSLKLVDVLPNYTGSNAVFPHELVKLMGHDFDIDSLYIHRPAHYVKKVNGKLKFMKYGNNEDSKFDQFVEHYSNDKLVNLLTKEYIQDDLEKKEQLDARKKELLQMLSTIQEAYSMDDEDIVDKAERLRDADGTLANVDFLDPLAIERKLVEIKTEAARDAINAELKALDRAYTLRAMKELGLPSTEAEFNKTTKEQGELNPSILDNQILDAKIVLHTNPGVRKITSTPATLTAIEEALDELAAIKGLDSYEEMDKNYDVSSLSGLMQAIDSNRAGQESIGAAVNATQIFSRLREFRIQIGEKVLQNLPTFNKFSSTGYLSYLTQSGERIMDLLSTLTSAMTDNAKYGYVKKLGLTIDVLSNVANLVSLGYDFRTSLFLVNQDYVKRYTNFIENKNNPLRPASDKFTNPQAYLNNLKKDITTRLKQLDATLPEPEDMLNFTTDELLFNLSEKKREGQEEINYLITNLKALEAYEQLEPITRTFATVGNIIKITKGTGSTFEEEDMIMQNLETLKVGVQKDSSGWHIVPVDKPHPIFPGIINIFKHHALTAANLKSLADKRSLTGKVAISQTKTFRDIMKGVASNLKQRLLRREAKIGYSKKSLLSFMSLKAYAKVVAGTKHDISNLTDLIYNINPDEPTLRDEFMQLSEQYPELVGQSIALHSLGFNPRTTNGFTGIAYNSTKGNTGFESRLKSDFENLYNHVQTRPFVIKLFNYLIAKDGLQFKNESFINIMPAQMFSNFSRASEKVKQLLNNPAATNEDYMEVFGKSKQEVIDEYQEMFVRDYNNLFDVTYVKDELNSNNFPVVKNEDGTITFDLFKGWQNLNHDDLMVALANSVDPETGEPLPDAMVRDALKGQLSEQNLDTFIKNRAQLSNLFAVYVKKVDGVNITKVHFKDGFTAAGEEAKGKVWILKSVEDSTKVKGKRVIVPGERSERTGLKAGIKATYELKTFLGDRYNKVVPYGMGIEAAETVTQDKLKAQTTTEVIGEEVPNGERQVNSLDQLAAKKATPITPTQPTSTTTTTPNVKTYEGRVETLTPNQVFVFGSNPEGRHGAGTAQLAKNKFGAKYGQGRGIQGQAYALVTKNLTPGFVEPSTGIKYDKAGEKSVSPEQIIENIDELYQVALANPGKEFLIAYTTDGANLNGYTAQEMADMFSTYPIPSNVVFNKEFAALLKGSTVKPSQMDNVVNAKNQEKEDNLHTIDSNMLPSEDVIVKALVAVYKSEGMEHLDAVFKVKNMTLEQKAEEFNLKCK
jgi:hypothetical protein